MTNKKTSGLATQFVEKNAPCAPDNFIYVYFSWPPWERTSSPRDKNHGDSRAPRARVSGAQTRDAGSGACAPRRRRWPCSKRSRTKAGRPPRCCCSPRRAPRNLERRAEFCRRVEAFAALGSTLYDQQWAHDPFLLGNDGFATLFLRVAESLGPCVSLPDPLENGVAGGFHTKGDREFL